MEKKARNIFEQILFGLEATNANVVVVSEEIALLRHDMQALKAGLYIDENISEPNALGAEEVTTVESINTQES